MPIDAITQGLLGARPLTNAIGDLGEEAGQNQATNRLGLGDDTFLKLLITQMQMQDPLSPMDSEELLSQVATLTMLEQLIQMNQNLDTYLVQQSLLQAGNLLGKVVEATLDDGSIIKGKVESVHQAHGYVTLYVKGYSIPLEQVTRVYGDEAAA
jgi:flagellar basal-body rod modification protein FlgD